MSNIICHLCGRSLYLTKERQEGEIKWSCYHSDFWYSLNQESDDLSIVEDLYSSEVIKYFATIIIDKEKAYYIQAFKNCNKTKVFKLTLNHKTREYEPSINYFVTIHRFYPLNINDLIGPQIIDIFSKLKSSIKFK